MGGYSKEGMQFVLLDKEGVEVGFPMTPSGDGQEDSIWFWKLEGKVRLGLILPVFR